MSMCAGSSPRQFTRGLQTSSNHRDQNTRAFVPPPPFPEHCLRRSPALLDCALQHFRPEHPLGLVFRQCHRRLEWPGRHGDCYQVHVRGWLGGKPKSAPSLSAPDLEAPPAAFPNHFSSDHRSGVGDCIRAVEPKLQVGAGHRKHRIRVDANSRPTNHDQKAAGDPFKGESGIACFQVLIAFAVSASLV
jgi:hypothetical protein